MNSLLHRCRTIAQASLALVVLCACVRVWAPAAISQEPPTKIPGVPDRTEGVGIDAKLGNQVSLDLLFKDQFGKTQRLGNLIDGTKPVLLTMNYSDCPGLCVAQLDGLVRGLERMEDPVLGKDFQVISISIDPTETPEKAMGTYKKYTRSLGTVHKADGWHFLTGSTDSIFKIADDVGFRYTYDSKNKRYNHAAMAVAISPSGKITRYVYDTAFEPATMRLALLEASEGKIGTTLDAFILWCMHYDESENRYSADARKLLAIGAGFFVIVVLAFSYPFWFGKPKSGDGNSNVATMQLNAETLNAGKSDVEKLDTEVASDASASADLAIAKLEQTNRAEAVATGSTTETSADY